MIDPAFFARLIRRIEDSGMGREEIAKKLETTGSNVSMIKAGKSFPDDKKMGVLSELIGGDYTERELLSAKYVIWLRKKKGLEIEDLISTTRRVKPN